MGVISDTHGLVRDGVLELFRGVDRILHAGDVGDPDVLAALEALAPVSAVWGNVDGFDVRQATVEVVEEELGGVRTVVIHGHQVRRFEELVDRFPGAGLIVHGHSHRPAGRFVGATLLLNPGSAGPKRFGDPVTAVLAELGDRRVQARFVDLETGGPFRPATS